MKTTIIKLKEPDENDQSKFRRLNFPLSVILIVMILFGFTIIPDQVVQKEEESRDRKIDLLEKLESGKQVSSEEIWSSYDDDQSDDPEFAIPCLPSLPDIQILSPSYPLPCPYFYHFDSIRKGIIISDEELKDLHERLEQSVKELRKNIEVFHNSKDFIIFQEELGKWKEDFRKEMEKIKEELTRSNSEIRNQL